MTRHFVRNCQTPVLILPDDIPAHPYAVAMETAMLAPNAEVSMFPWKEPKERIPLAVPPNTFLPPSASASPCLVIAGSGRRWRPAVQVAAVVGKLLVFKHFRAKSPLQVSLRRGVLMRSP